MILDFTTAAYISIALWALAAMLGVAGKGLPAMKRASSLAGLLGSVVICAFIALYWSALERPPLRTLGETRLWYAALIPLVGLLVESRWGISWLKYYCMALASFFLSINLMHPEVFDKALMPALQSPWFIPHVVVYLVGYVLLAASSVSGWHNIFLTWRKKNTSRNDALAHYLALLGFVFLTFGLVFGALWAKDAWGNYWSWDPKETWAFIAWLIYLGYLHASSSGTGRLKLQWYLALAFLVLLVSWFGVNYLPTAASSVHTYQQS